MNPIGSIPVSPVSEHVSAKEEGHKSAASSRYSPPAYRQNEVEHHLISALDPYTKDQFPKERRGRYEAERDRNAN
jgi:hypothetical protein